MDDTGPTSTKQSPSPSNVVYTNIKWVQTNLPLNGGQGIVRPFHAKPDSDGLVKVAVVAEISWHDRQYTCIHVAEGLYPFNSPEHLDALDQELLKVKAVLQFSGVNFGKDTTG